MKLEIQPCVRAKTCSGTVRFPHPRGCFTDKDDNTLANLKSKTSELVLPTEWKTNAAIVHSSLLITRRCT